MSNVNGGTITVTVAGKDVGLTELLTRINTQMAQSGQSARNYATAMAQLDPVARSNQQALAGYAQSLAAVAKAQGDTLGSQQILASVLQTQLTPNTQAANQVLAQLQNNINQASKGAAQSTNNFSQMATGLAKLASAYFLVSRGAQAFGELINQGNELEKTLTTFRVLSGSQEQYTQNLAIARQQQELFGGSLQDTVEGMSAFANLSKNTGVEIGKLTNLARALAIVDPAQGFKGAGIALKEFFSGDITSLARRFEIPRDALNSVKEITDSTEKFQALEQVLAKFGISTELLAAQTTTTATAYAKLSGSVQDAQAAIGQYLGQTLLPLAEGLTNVAKTVTTAFDSLRTKAQDMQAISGKIFDATATEGLDAFNAKIAETNAQIAQSDPIFGLLVGRLQELTPAQYQLVQALVATGLSAGDAVGKLNENAHALDVIRSNIASATAWYGIGAQQAQDFAFALSQTAITSQEAAGFAQGLAQAVANGLPVEQAMIALQQFKANAIKVAADAQAEQTQQTEVAAQATQLFTEKLTAEALEKANSQIAGEALKVTQEGLYNAALAAAQGMGATQQAAAALAGQFGVTTGEAYNLISALQQLEVAKAKQALGIAPNERTTGHGDEILATPAQLIQQQKALELSKKLADVKLANARAAATAAQGVEIEREQLNKLTKGTVEYEQQLGRLEAAERKLQAEKERNAKKNGGAPKLTPNEKINTGLLDQQDKFNDKFEDAEQKHWDKVADIYAKFNEEQQKQFAKNEVSKRRSRADFYAGLQDAPPGVDTQKFAAQYEEAFAKAQEIAQSGKAKLAEQFLELRQRQIEEMQKLDEESAKIVQQQKEGKISKKDAQAQLDYLEGRKKLIQDAQQEEQQQLLNAGDENQKRLQDQLNQEEQAYADQTDKIALQSERAANAKITHAQRSKIAVSEENKELAKQQNYYQRIAQLNGGVVPANQRGTAPPVSSGGTQGKEAAPVNVEADNPIPITSAEAIVVRQAELFLVHDADTMASIGDMATRVEGKLSELITAVGTAKDAITGAVNAVEGAVGRIKLQSASVVGN